MLDLESLELDEFEDIGTGLDGYLGRILKLENTKNLKSIEYIHLAEYKPKNVWVFGCPSNKEDIKNNPSRLCDTINHLDVLEHLSLNNAHIIYASSIGVLDMNPKSEFQLLYNQYKKVTEHYILTKIPKSTIFRIPRVLGPKRKKGIIKTLREGNFEGPREQKIQYINEKDFRDWVLSHYDICGLFSYPRRMREITIEKLDKLIQEDRLDEL